MKIDRKRWHYHTLRGLQNELVWDGQYDLYPLWKNFGIPDNLKSQSVLDIGTATGFFAFECEKRGASKVVATELPDANKWDTNKAIKFKGTNIPLENQKDFNLAHNLFNSQVKLFSGNICDSSHEKLGKFDWVIFGSLMTHLKDIILALGNVKKLTGGRAVIISSYYPDDSSLTLHWIKSDRPFDWWVPTKNLIPEMLKSVGFNQVVEVGDFVLRHRNGTEQNQSCWHAW